MKSHSIAIPAVAALLICASAVLSSIPYQFNFQGTLTDTAGNPITGTRNFQFYLYADSVGGSTLWNESHIGVEVDNGIFQVSLGNSSPFSLDLFTGQTLWLETVAQGETLSPRTKIISVPYSFKAAKSDHSTISDSAMHAVYADTADWASSGVAITHVDTADFAFYADSAGIAASASESDHAAYSDTADWALGFDIPTHVDTSDYALYADSAQYAASAPADSDWIASADSLYHLNCNVGIGTASPDKRLTIKGASEADDACIRLDAYWNPEIFLDKGGYEADTKINFQSQGTTFWTFYNDGSEDALKFNHVGTGNLMTLSGDSNAVGIGTMFPEAKLDVEGTVQMTGFKMSPASGSAEGKVLTADVSGVGTWQDADGTIGGQGSADYLTKFTDSTSIENSIVYQAGDSIGIATTTPGARLDVNGDVKVTGFSMTTGPGNGKVLTSDAMGVGSWATTIGGSGSSGNIPIFTDAHTLGNSEIVQSGTNIRIGGAANTHKLNIYNTSTDDVLRLLGPDGFYAHGARLNFGDADYVYLEEDIDDALTVYGSNRTAIMGGDVGIGTISPSAKLHVDGNLLCNALSTGLGFTEVYAMNQNVQTTDNVTFGTVNTGQGAHELYAMNQNVRTSDAVTFLTINTGPGATEVYPMNQYVRTSDNVTFASVNTGQGANELYDMNQNVTTASAVTFNTLNTGYGANELYAMNQNVRTTDNPTFNRLYLNGYGYALGGFHIGGTSNPGTSNLRVDGIGRFGTSPTSSTHVLTADGYSTDDVLRLLGPDGGVRYGARINFGDADYVYLDEDTDDHLVIHGTNGIMLSGSHVSVDNMNGTTGGTYVRWYNDRLYYDSSSKKYKANIQPMKDDFSKILKVEPKSFIDKVTGEHNIGYIAEELDEIGLDNLVIEKNGEPDAIKYQLVSLYLLEIVKDQNSQIAELRERIEAIEADR